MTQTQSELHDIENIAIIGMSARLPGARTVAEFWQNICSGVESVTFFSNEELLRGGVSPVDLSASTYVRAGQILDGVELFDAEFFGIPSSEAVIMDPQHRFFLECAWEALEDGGYDPSTYPGWISVFGGVGTESYLIGRLLPFLRQFETIDESYVMQISLGNKGDFLTMRVSYKLNLKGPSFNVQTACSTSLVAVHLACQSLLSYQCDMALAGGVSIGERCGYHTQAGFLSPDGHVRPFDAAAQGTVFGHGVGIVLLKRLSEALADGDHIYAVIRGSAINNDGSSKVGFTAPSVDGQVSVISLAHAAAGINPETISYVETHGTGTALGDPIEIEALTEAFRSKTDKKQFCAIASVKGNIGHTDTAAGVAGLIKTALALKHRMIPPSINYSSPNPKIDFANSPFFVNTELRGWKTDGHPRRAGVSAFGMGGTNAHVIVEEAPQIEPAGPTRRFQLLALSARTDTALETMTDRIIDYIQASPDIELADLSYTLHVGRHAFDKRRVVVCEHAADGIAALRERDPQRVFTKTHAPPARGVAFMFSGQGAQYINMGRDLYQREAVFRQEVDRCAQLLYPHLGLDLRMVLYPDDPPFSSGAARGAASWTAEHTRGIDQTRFVQPALFVVEYALAQVWMSWGIKPQAMIGHSIGEYVAACLSGVFDLEDALALVAARGRLMQGLPPGAMLSVNLSEKEVQPFLNGILAVAAVNEPASCVVSGPSDAIAAFEQLLNERGIGCRRLHTSHAFHSPMMEPILEPFIEQVRHVSLSAPCIPYLSNVTGTWITPAQATDPGYWAQHIRQTVRFSAGIGVLAQSPDQVLIEVGPGNTLRNSAQRHPDRAAQQVALASMRHPRERHDDQAVLLQALGKLWISGVSVDWKAFYRDQRRRRISLPTYPFERQRYWLDVQENTAARRMPLLKNPNLAEWFYLPSWKCTLPPVPEPQAPASRWLVFGDDDRLVALLMQKAAARGHAVVWVEAGERFSANDQGYTVRPGERADYDALFTLLKQRAQLPTHIVHLLNIVPLDQNEAEDLLERSFYSLLFLAQALDEYDLDELQLVVISSNVQRVTGDEVLHPEKAVLLGPCKVIPQELPKVACRSIDIVRPGAETDQEAQLIEQLLAEIETRSEDTLISYRGDQRWVRTYELSPLEDVKDQLSGRLRTRGVYLITGGLGGIGLTLAEYLARAVQARLILTSRSPFPNRESWGQYLATHDPRDRTSQHIRAVQAMEALGAEVWVAQADVIDLTQMTALVRAACERFGTLHGVLHAAGLPGGGVIQLKTKAAASQVLASKVQGTRVLEAALGDLPLDFFVLCSSITALTGGVGQVDYCAANAFMDVYAQARHRHKGPLVVSINWDAWSEVGMAVNTPPNYTTARSAPLLSTSAVDHPLIRAVAQETTEHTTYSMEMNPAEQWVLAEHILLGAPTVPGATYLDLARAAFADRTKRSQLEIREALFFEPLRVAEGDCKTAQLILTESEGGFNFRVISQAGVALNGEVIWQTHVVGQMVPLVDTALVPYDLASLRARCNISAVTVTAESIQQTAAGYLTFGPRWYNTLKCIYLGKDEALAELELDAPFVADLASFQLHPALLDIATSFPATWVGQGYYLPLAYKQVRFSNPLPPQLYSYARLKSGSVAGAETITLHVTLLDQQGRHLVDIHEFTLKRVGETAATRLTGSEEATPPKPAMLRLLPNERRERPLDHAIHPEEGVEAFRRILVRGSRPQIAVCTKHLPALIESLRNITPERQGGSQAQLPVDKHARPNLQTRYTPPRTEVEAKLASMWQDVLGIEQVGVNDNFFELGGDSIIGIQVVAKIRMAGFQLNVEQIFQHQTIAQLAQVLQPSDATPVGSLLLTPRQAALLASPNRMPYILVVSPKHRLDLARLEVALQSVLAQHDALRLQFEQTDNGWQQVVSDRPYPIHALLVDMGGHSLEESDDSLRVEIARLQGAFDTPEPPLLRVTYLQAGTEQGDRLLLALSPLSADEASLPILVHDVCHAYQHGALPLPATPFTKWIKRVTAWCQSDAVHSAHGYWQTIAAHAYAPLPSSGAGTAVRQTISARLNSEETELLQGLPESCRIAPEEVILTALAKVVSVWIGHRRILIGVCDYGRDMVLEDLDTMHTIGCLRADYPLCLDVPQMEDANALLKDVKEQVRSAAQHGLSYGYLRTAGDALALKPSLTFTYCPPCPETLLSVLQVHTPKDDSGASLQLKASMCNGQLELDWQYDTSLYSQETLVQLSSALVETLRGLIRHCGESKGMPLTPSDFPEAELDQEMLERLLAHLG